MNPLPPNADELVSAYLDNEATPDEIAIVESEPELLSRVEELRALSGVLGAPLSAPGEQKEAHLAAALGAFDELFGDNSSSATSDSATSDSATSDSATSTSATSDSATSTSATSDSATSTSGAIVSFEAARERRRPRRFNSSVIAAVAAAVLLVVGLAALSFGRGGTNNDVATAADANVQAAESMPGDAASAEADSDAMTDSAESSALSELDSSRAAEAPAAAFQADEPADDEESFEAEAPMDDASSNDAADFDADTDDEDSGADQATDEADSFAADDGGAVVGEAAPLAYDVFLGDFVDTESLREELEQLTAQDLRKRAETFEPGLFPGCQQEIPELAKADSVTFVGQATIDDQLVEIHIVSTNNRGVSLLVIDPFDDCSILSTIP